MSEHRARPAYLTQCFFQSEVSLHYQKADPSIKFQKKTTSRCYRLPNRSVFFLPSEMHSSVKPIFSVTNYKLKLEKVWVWKRCFAWVRNFGEALTNDAKHLFHTSLLPTAAVPAQFRIRSISLSAVAEWKEADKLLFTCKHDTEFACSFRTACCFVKFINFWLLYLRCLR